MPYLQHERGTQFYSSHLFLRDFVVIDGNKPIQALAKGLQHLIERLMLCCDLTQLSN